MNLLRIFGWQVVRDVRRHPVLAALNIFSVALGIAVFLAIQIANGAANRSFAATVDLATGKSHLEVRGPLDENLWPALAHTPGVTAATGLVEGIVTLPDHPGEYLRVTGIDIFSYEPFQTFFPDAHPLDTKWEEWLGKPGRIVLPADLAAALKVHPGEELRALVNGEIKTLTVLAVANSGESPAAAGQRFALIDIGWAQELLGLQGKLSSVQLRVEHPERAHETAALLNAKLPPDLRAETPRQRGVQLQQMVSAFELNLSALSMVSLLVGVFLIYNTISASVSRRRREIGILRALGASRLEVRALFLGEALLFGILGVTVGIVAGCGLAQVLSGAVARTVTSLYVLVSIGKAHPDMAQLAIAACFGCGTVLAGAWLPASEAARVDPVAAIHGGYAIERSRGRAPSPALLALTCVLLSALCSFLALRGVSPILGFAAAFFILLGTVLLARPAARVCGAIVSRAASARAITWRIAADNLRRSIHRNSMTIGALAAALAMLTGLSIMIFSFRTTVWEWIEHGIVADVFIAPASNEQIGLGATVPPAAIRWLEARSDVAGVDTIREQEVSVCIASWRELAHAQLVVVGGVYRNNLAFKGGHDEAKARQIFGGGRVGIAESFARRFKVNEGARVALLTPAGPAEFEVAGVYSDYSRDQGAVLIDRRNFDKFWNESGVHSLAIFLAPGAKAETISRDFRAAFGRDGEFSIYSNRALRERILKIFDQTFAVTAMLRAVAFLVAIAAVYLSMTTLVAEREREIGILRAIGASAPQIQAMLVKEAALIGLAAAALGLAGGAALAFLLTAVVNPAFFGWSIDFRLPWPALLATPAWVVAAAALAAWRPSWQAGRANIAVAIRSE